MFTTVEITLGTMTFTVSVLMFNVLKLKKGFVMYVEMTPIVFVEIPAPHKLTQEFVERLE
jgi:hypothetical protein